APPSRPPCSPRPPPSCGLASAACATTSCAAVTSPRPRSARSSATTSLRQHHALELPAGHVAVRVVLAPDRQELLVVRGQRVDLPRPLVLTDDPHVALFVDADHGIRRILGATCSTPPASCSLWPDRKSTRLNSSH